MSRAIDRIFGIFNADTWANVLNGIGVKGRDRRRETAIEVDTVTNEEARDMWRTDFLARACIEKLPQEAFREGFTIKITDGDGTSNKEVAEDVQTKIEELGLTPKFVKATQFERAYGGGALMPVLNDQQGSMATRLIPERIATVKAIHVFEPRELQPMTWYSELTDEKYRMPKTYRLQPLGGNGVATGGGIEVHESRLIVFPGVRVSNDWTVAELPGWGDNALTIAKQTLADFGLSIGSVATMLDQFSQGVLKLDGLAEMLGVDNGKRVRDRLAAMDMAKSVLRTLVIDKNDEYTREDVSFTGVPDSLRTMMYIVAAALDVPVALLFGMEPAGMNATGAFDIRSFYDRVHSVRVSRYQHPLEQLIRFIMLAKDGPTGGVEPEQWSVEWRPLWQMTDKEREETRKIRTENDVAIIDAGIATADEIREQRYGGDTYSYELQLSGAAPVAKIPDEHVTALEAANTNRGRARNPPPDEETRALIEGALAEGEQEAA